MNYFQTADKHKLRVKLIERKQDRESTDEAKFAVEHGTATKAQKLDLFFLTLATRLLRAKFYSSPALTNEELAYLTGCSSGTYLGLLMTRQKQCSKDMAVMMSINLRKFETSEGMQPIQSPEYPV